MLYLDLDGFKEVNDRCGHAVGDRALATIAEGIRSHLRSADVLGRLGGDEFLVVADQVEGVEEVFVVAERIRSTVASIEPAPGMPPVTVSIGIALDNGCSSAASVIEDADSAMYRAKHERDRWEVAERGERSIPTIHETTR